MFENENDWSIVFFFRSHNMRFGLVGVPTVLLMQDGKVAGKFNGTGITLEALNDFVQKTTNLEAVGKVEILDQDYKGPVPTVLEPSFDYVLVICALFVLFMLVYYVRRSRIYNRLSETVRNAWQESQREHLD